MKILINICLFLTLIYSSSLFAASYPKTPDKNRTTGKLCDQRDPDFQTFRYPARIPYCKRNVSSSDKSYIKRVYGIPDSDHANYIIDHLIPLSIGGSNHESNLWPEHKCITTSRNQWEEGLFQKVSAGYMTQEQAVREALKIKFDPTQIYTNCRR